MSKIKRITILISVIAIVAAGIPVILHKTNMTDMAMENFYGKSDTRIAFADKQKAAIYQLVKEGKYRCCIENPCSYCFLNSTPEEDGTICDCLDEVMNGEHPCGECMGEILEGNGNKFLSEYFPAAIADEVGDKYLETLEEIIDDKYNKIK